MGGVARLRGVSPIEIARYKTSCSRDVTLELFAWLSKRSNRMHVQTYNFNFIPSYDRRPRLQRCWYSGILLTFRKGNPVVGNPFIIDFCTISVFCCAEKSFDSEEKSCKGYSPLHYDSEASVQLLLASEETNNTKQVRYIFVVTRSLCKII